MIAKYYQKSINLSTNPEEEEEGDKKTDQPSIRDRSNDKPSEEKVGGWRIKLRRTQILKKTEKKKWVDKPSVDNEGTVINILRNILKPN